MPSHSGPEDPPDPNTNCSFDVDEDESEPPVGCDYGFPEEVETDEDDE
jgi:hypothetical protein